MIAPVKMKPFTLLSLFITFATRTVEVAAAQGAKISVTGALTGVNLGTGAAPPRINIKDLYQEGGPPWDLYVQALAELQAVDESDYLSYFSIMGIHGLPFQGWNGVGQVAGGAELAGFCPHNELLFGLWHRPYIALYEQTLVSHALNISQRYTGQDAVQYLTAAETLRVAYWDWAQDPTLPEVVTLETVNLNSPTGPTTMRNPFHSYHFQKFPFTTEYMTAGVLSTYNRTARCPTAGLTDNVAAVDAGLAASGSLKAQVYDVFTTVQAFQDMETDRYSKPSFESPHNNVHDSVGCSNGTMYDLNWSAFDPIFMLHHANVDRLIAMWQAIYPDSSIFDITDFEGALYGTAAGNVNADTPLKPFYHHGGNFHTSDTVRNISTFGYSYPELNLPGQQPSSVDPGTLSDHVKYQVNSLYSDVSVSSTKFRRSTVGKPSSFGRHAPSKTWSIAIQVDKAEVLLPATVGCYLGASPVGRMALLSIPPTGVTHSTIPLDAALSAANLDLANEEVVLPYLKQNLRFEVQKGDGTQLDTDSIPSLEFVVQDRDVTPRHNDRTFPTYGATTSHPWSPHID